VAVQYNNFYKGLLRRAFMGNQILGRTYVARHNGPAWVGLVDALGLPARAIADGSKLWKAVTLLKDLKVPEVRFSNSVTPNYNPLPLPQQFLLRGTHIAVYQSSDEDDGRQYPVITLQNGGTSYNARDGIRKVAWDLGLARIGNPRDI
jgi:hypothetical protein